MQARCRSLALVWLTTLGLSGVTGAIARSRKRPASGSRDQASSWAFDGIDVSRWESEGGSIVLTAAEV